jgi:hypothetical protein
VGQEQESPFCKPIGIVKTFMKRREMDTKYPFMSLPFYERGGSASLLVEGALSPNNEAWVKNRRAHFASQ